jgi:homogentisate 1,2-dioxygenase
MKSELRYLTGFGGHFESEAAEGALPKGRNSPQRPAFGLYAEQLSGSSFTAPRHENRRSWLYRLRPTADHRPFVAYQGAPLFGSPPSAQPLAPNRLRWDPPELAAGTDFVDGLATMLHARQPEDLVGCALHLYRASRSMDGRVFVNADGELVVIPQEGAI